MRKILLSLGAALCATVSFSQVIFTIEAPAGIAGPYTFETASSWGMDMSIPGNSVLDTVMLADDSLACAPLVNDLTGKIALIYRGSCEFGAKALAAQNAGAVGVIIVNNAAGAPIPMGAGAQGANVTIPVVMVSNVDGALIYSTLQTGTVVAFMGNKTGYFADDIGFQATDVMRADYGGVANTIAQNGTEFAVNPGAWVYNYGTNNQTGITLTAAISGTTYNEVSAPFDLLSGDSTYVTFTAYAPATWTVGSHTLSYTLAFGAVDQYPADNQLSSSFDITDQLISLARLTNGLPTSDGGTKSGDATTSFTSCIHFRDANASRMGAQGMYFSGSTLAADSLTGLEINVTAYSWDDVFTDVNDANFTITTLNEVASGSYTYDADLQDSMIYIPFQTPFLMQDNQRYLFCATDYTLKIYIGYDSESKYVLNENTNLQPLYPIQSDATWYASGFTGSPVPALGVKTYDASEAAVNENVLTSSAFPNPAKDNLTVKVKAEGDAVLKITDLAGRVVATQAVKIAGGQFTTSVAGMTAGTYVFALDFENGTSSRFNVVVAK